MRASSHLTSSRRLHDFSMTHPQDTRDSVNIIDLVNSVQGIELYFGIVFLISSRQEDF